MIKTTIPGKNGYSIPVLHNIQGTEALLVVISHGFASDKESSTAQLLMEALAQHNLAGISYDMPAHGESEVDGQHLRIAECLDSLADVEAYAHTLAPKAKIAYFSSSFGGYINLLYLALRPHAGQSAFLRCAAVNMPELFEADTTADMRAEMAEKGCYLLDYGYGRPLLITRGFYTDLQQNNAFSLYRKGTARLEMIHGSMDEEVPLAAVQQFATQFSIPLHIVEGADHRFTNPGGMEQVLEAALRFFMPELD